MAHIRCDHLTGARIGDDLHRGSAQTEAESVAAGPDVLVIDLDTAAMQLYRADAREAIR